MRRTLLPLTLLALVAAGCGSSNSGSGAAATTGGKTVNVRQVGGIGSVLVDSHGAALYSPVQKATDMIRCSGACTSIWIPLKAGTATPTAGSGVTDKLATVMRLDGSRQVTYDGRPLYTFTQDGGPGKVTGNGASDSFGGTSFTWHALTAKGAPAAAKAPAKTGGTYSY